MPRNAQGKYFLPDGNPVEAGELVKAEWANSTLEDVGNALTNSLDRTGNGGMVGPLKASDGTLAHPSVTFANDTSSGFYKELSGIVAGVAQGVKQFHFSKNGFFLAANPVVSMQAATKAYADTVSSQVTKIIGAFGSTKTPSQLPATGTIPANWDAPGVPFALYQMQVGDALIYLPNDEADANYGSVYVYVGVKFVASGWEDVGPIQGPQGPEGKEGPKGDRGPEGPIGLQGPTGKTGAQGPEGAQGKEGPQGPQGPQGVQGAAGNTAVLIGSFGASKTPADLPTTGVIPANWDSQGNPPVEVTMMPGEALIYNACSPSTPGYGDVYSYVGTKYVESGWTNCGDIVGPEGPQGVTGAQGPQGDTGPQGPAGANGATGPQGPAGADGAPGSQGVQGPQGPQGATGGPIIGMISMFAGAQYLPAGWFVCDGTNGTPNLLDRFIVGAGGTFAPNAVGGSFTISPECMPSHAHTYSGNSDVENQGHTHDMGAQQVNITGATTGAAGAHSHGVSDPGHGHTTSTSYMGGTGTGGTNANLTGGGGSSVTPNAGNGVNANTTGISLYAVGDHTHPISGAATIQGSTGNESATHYHGYSGTTSSVGAGENYLQPYFALIFAMYLGA